MARLRKSVRSYSLAKRHIGMTAAMRLNLRFYKRRLKTFLVMGAILDMNDDDFLENIMLYYLWKYNRLRYEPEMILFPENPRMNVKIDNLSFFSVRTDYRLNSGNDLRRLFNALQMPQWFVT